MKNFILLVTIFIAILTPYSCEDSILFVDCKNCFTTDYNQISLELYVTIDNENPLVEITLYRGKIDNGEVISEEIAYSTDYFTKYEAKFGEYYSAIAKYYDNGRITYVVDGKKLRKNYDNSTCENPCYLIQGAELNLRLK